MNLMRILAIVALLMAVAWLIDVLYLKKGVSIVIAPLTIALLLWVSTRDRKK